jgi:hypothetical protein
MLLMNKHKRGARYHIHKQWVFDQRAKKLAMLHVHTTEWWYNWRYNRTPCSCYMCCNPRRNGHLTIQELRARQEESMYGY